LWKTRSLEIKSVASLAAFIASVFGITRRASENSAIASYSRVPKVLAKLSRNTESETSTAPPPATSEFDSRTLLITQSES